MKTNVKKIVLVGKSNKFLGLVNFLFDGAELITVPWRDCLDYVSLTEGISPDLIVVCGYDYASSHYGYNRYIEVNVTRPFQLIRALSQASTKIVYIDTEHGTNPVTFSRYQYAKSLLAQKVLSEFDNGRVLNIPTVRDVEGRADIHGGYFTKFIFDLFIKFGLVKTVSLEVMQKMFLCSLESKSQSRLNTLTPCFLGIRRTLFVDRLLRFISG